MSICQSIWVRCQCKLWNKVDQNCKKMLKKFTAKNKVRTVWNAMQIQEFVENATSE